jgi:hypothetical protein
MKADINAKIEDGQEEIKARQDKANSQAEALWKRDDSLPSTGSDEPRSFEGRSGRNEGRGGHLRGDHFN